jgi:valyl-tRNA synthetase
MTNPLAKQYDITSRENHWREFWDTHNIYAFDEHSDKPIYSVDTPPPYVSADHLHAGHIMSYSQAEFVVRFKRMRGFNVFYPMGFDDNGLPTERYVEKKYNINKNKTSRSEFIKLCLDETRKGAKNYRDLWYLLGISVDWSKTYSTINPNAQKISQWSFLDLYKKGLIYRKEQPMLWDISFQTALAQTDLEDSEEDSFLNDIEFKAENGTSLIISTTRPELIPACVALFYNPNDTRYTHLAGQKAIVPISGHKVPILTDEKVALDYGTGLMMVCTWGDNEDIEKWQIHKLDTRCLFDEKGIVNANGGAYQGVHIAKLRPQILEDLDKMGLLKAKKVITHTIQVSERSGIPVEFVMSKQWFINILDHKEELLEQGKKLNWYPTKMFSIYADWVNSLKWDWCLSRQRFYGVPMPIWYKKTTGEVVLPDESELPVDPTEYTPKGYQKEDLIPETDVMDTWMTSSMSPSIGAQLVSDPDLQAKLYPSSLRPQAFEIIRTWLFYTVVKSLYHHQNIPFVDVMISGHGLDDKGRKISKRLGNYVQPDKIVAEYGSDALRYWATGATLGESLRYSQEEIKKGKKTVTKLFNSAKFCEMHLPKNLELDLNKLEASDRYILYRLNQTIVSATEFFDKYEYSKARDIIDKFFWTDLSDNYVEFIKYRLYDENDSESKLIARKVLANVIRRVIGLYAPILPFITEEAYQALFRDNTTPKSLHLTAWPQVIELNYSDQEAQEFKEILKVVEKVRGYKSSNGISLGKEIEEYTYQGSAFLKNHTDFLQRALRVTHLIVE